jgi:hypothetical protein
MNYFLRLITRCGCVRDESFGTSLPKTIPPEWTVALLSRSAPIMIEDLNAKRLAKVPTQYRKFEYSGSIKERSHTYLLYIEKEPG